MKKSEEEVDAEARGGKCRARKEYGRRMGRNCECIVEKMKGDRDACGPPTNGESEKGKELVRGAGRCV